MPSAGSWVPFTVLSLIIKAVWREGPPVILDLIGKSGAWQIKSEADKSENEKKKIKNPSL